MFINSQRERARALLRQFKGDSYVFGVACLASLGEQVRLALEQRAGAKRVAVVISGVARPWGPPLHEAVRRSLEQAGVTIAGAFIAGARPNAPREDVSRIAAELEERAPDGVLVVAGGSGIDATKAAVAWRALRDLHPDLDAYFGVGEVTRMLAQAGRCLPPIIAAQLAAGSAAHLTKYSNITDLARAQKLLVVDDAIVPPLSLFDYSLTTTVSRDHTIDGALDGVAHGLEVWLGASLAHRDRLEPICLGAIDLIARHVKAACQAPDNLDAREALGLGTDLGGYAIMLGATSGAHLTSFSLVDILTHGRACAVMNPYYLVFFAPAVEERIRAVGAIYAKAGYIRADLERLHGHDLGVAVAEGMLALQRDIGFPTRLADVAGFTPAHIQRALAAAKNPKLAMKLKAMPIPLTAEMIDEHMAPVLEAARTGDFALIK